MNDTWKYNNTLLRESDKLHEIYKSYLLECEDEISSTRHPMSFEEFCEFFGVDEHTSDEDLYYIFCD